MQPELERALRLNGKIRKRLRAQLQILELAVAEGSPDEIVTAARAFVDLEREADADVRRKRPEHRRHLVKFRVTDAECADLAETAVEYRLEPDEVARRFFDCGRQFAQHFWGHVRRGGTAETLFSRGPGGESPLPAFILPDFSRREP